MKDKGKAKKLIQLERRGVRHLNEQIVKSLLAEKDSNPTALAKTLGISQPYMYDLLKGTRNPEQYIKRIAELLEVSESAITRKRES